MADGRASHPLPWGLKVSSLAIAEQNPIRFKQARPSGPFFFQDEPNS